MVHKFISPLKLLLALCLTFVLCACTPSHCDSCSHCINKDSINKDSINKDSANKQKHSCMGNNGEAACSGDAVASKSSCGG
jgi:hypothetical protein